MYSCLLYPINLFIISFFYENDLDIIDMNNYIYVLLIKLLYNDVPTD